jgi:hypothetical protein
MLGNISLLSILCSSAAFGQANAPNFFNRGGVALFNPIIDVVNSGNRLVVRPTVSADRKYVTISGQFQNTQVVAIQNFPFFTAGFSGTVGGAQAAPANPVAAARNINASSPVRINQMSQMIGSLLDRVGMTRIDTP